MPRSTPPLLSSPPTSRPLPCPPPPWPRFLLLLVAIGGCAPVARFDEGVYRRGSVAFRLGPLPPEWRRVRVRKAGGDGLTFQHGGGGTIHAGGTCDHPDDVPLDVLANHLLFGFEQRQEVSRQALVLDGRAALRTRVDARLDGVAVALDLVVTRKDDCTYDLDLIAGPQAYAERRADFDRLVAGFGQVAP